MIWKKLFFFFFSSLALATYKSSLRLHSRIVLEEYCNHLEAVLLFKSNINVHTSFTVRWNWLVYFLLSIKKVIFNKSLLMWKVLKEFVNSLLAFEFISIYLYTYKTLITLFVCLFEAVSTNPGYGMATLISTNFLNLILGTVILLRSS